MDGGMFRGVFEALVVFCLLVGACVGGCTYAVGSYVHRHVRVEVHRD